MLRSKLLTALLISGLLTGCATVRTSHDFDNSVDFASMQTYAWLSDTQPDTGDIRLDDPLVDQRIRAAVEQTLRAKGFQSTDRASADFLVSYQAGVRQKVKSDNVRTGFTFSTGSRGRYGSIGISSGTSVQSYDEGTLLIDVLDPESGALLWRGKGTDTISAHSDPDRRTGKIREAVEKILGQFPPGLR